MILKSHNNSTQHKPLMKGIIKSEKVNDYKRINKNLEIRECIISLIEIEDKRIAIGSNFGKISISSYDINDETWNIYIHKKNAHNGSVTSFCTLNGNRLLSSSDDWYIKVWAISISELTLIIKLGEHDGGVCKVIPLSNERFASCSADKTVKIWRDDNTYECISTLEHSYSVRSILQLRNKEVLVSLSSCGDLCSNNYVSFFDLNNYERQLPINDHHMSDEYRINLLFSDMLELSNGNIAISARVKPSPPFIFIDDDPGHQYPNTSPTPPKVIIIDSSSFQIVTMIQFKNLVTRECSLCTFNELSFIYVIDNKFFQISSEDGSIVYQSENGKNKKFKGIVSLKGGKYFAVNNQNYIIIAEPCEDVSDSD